MRALNEDRANAELDGVAELGAQFGGSVADETQPETRPLAGLLGVKTPDTQHSELGCKSGTYGLGQTVPSVFRAAPSEATCVCLT